MSRPSLFVSVLALALSACGGNPLPSQTAVELLPKLTVSALTPQVNEGDTARFEVRISEPSPQPVAVRYYTQPGTASTNDDPPDYAGQDNPFAPTEKVMNPGQETLEIEIPTTNDGVFEADETFRLYLHSAQGASVDTDANYFAEVTILDDDTPPALSLADTVPQSQVVLESGGTLELRFVLDNSNNTPGVDITVPLEYSGEAVMGEDFRAPTEVVLEKNWTLDEVTVEVVLLDDPLPGEGDRDLIITLGTPDNATLGGFVQTTVTIRDDDGAGALNDTGVTRCQDDSQDRPCPVDSHPGQDGEQVTPMQFSLYAVGDDQCIVDHRSGLMWEVKQPYAENTGSRWAGATYTWYEPADNRNGGDPGTNTAGSTTVACRIDNCTTSAYVAHLNETRLCGFDDWRLPTVSELVGLLHLAFPTCATLDNFGNCAQWAASDDQAFPNTRPARYWTASPSAYRPTHAWFVDFGKGTFSTAPKSKDYHLRAVRRIRDGDLPP